MTFAYPWLLFVPLLYGIVRLVPRRNERRAGFASSALLDQLPVSARLRLRGPTLFALSAASVVFLSIAAARPQHITLVDQEQRGRNICLVLDVSRSMTAQDFPTTFGHTSRMEGVKMVVSEYVRHRVQDRICLVVFGNTSYLQSPLTTDSALVEELVQGLQPGMAGDGTAIGDGLGLALKRLKEIRDQTTAIILMTDGVNNAGQVSPLKAARVAKDLGIRIHTIGIGSGDAPLGDTIINGVFSVPSAGHAEFDEETLEQIASTSGGVYFNARSLDRLKEVYREIEKLTESEDVLPAKTIIDELFPPFALAALGCYCFGLLLAGTVFMKVP